MPAMRKGVLLATLLLFIIWILPLGFFIKPSQEKKVCNGQRAICLCSKFLAKSSGQWTDKILLKNGTNTNKEASGFGGTSQNYLVAQTSNSIYKYRSSYYQQQSFLYFVFVARPIEHVPKV